jgi:hypothetical protein
MGIEVRRVISNLGSRQATIRAKGTAAEAGNRQCSFAGAAANSCRTVIRVFGPGWGAISQNDEQQRCKACRKVVGRPATFLFSQTNPMGGELINEIAWNNES